MSAGGTPSWVIRENASRPVLLALYLREVLGIASPVELPRLRDGGAVGDRLEIDRHDLLERQWRAWWAMTVEPEAHPSPVPLELVDAYETEVALPLSGAEVLAVDTNEPNTGIDIDHYDAIDMTGFSGLGDGLDGDDICNGALDNATGLAG